MGNKICGAHARCSRRNNLCQDVALHGKSGSIGAPNVLCPQLEACPTHFLSSSQCSTDSPSRRSPQRGPRPNLERATKLLHITLALLQSSDGRCSWQGRYNKYTRGELTGLIDWLVVFAGRSRQKTREDTPEARRLRGCLLRSVASVLLSRDAARGEIRALAALVMPPLSYASLLARTRRASGAFCRLLPANTTSQSMTPVSSPLVYSLQRPCRLQRPFDDCRGAGTL